LKALVNSIIFHEGVEYRLTAGKEAPDMPVELQEVLVKQKYVENQPQATFEKTKGGQSK